VVKRVPPYSKSYYRKGEEEKKEKKKSTLTSGRGKTSNQLSLPSWEGVKETNSREEMEGGKRKGEKRLGYGRRSVVLSREKKGGKRRGGESPLFLYSAWKKRKRGRGSSAKPQRGHGSFLIFIPGTRGGRVMLPLALLGKKVDQEEPIIYCRRKGGGKKGTPAFLLSFQGKEESGGESGQAAVPTEKGNREKKGVHFQSGGRGRGEGRKGLGRELTSDGR